DPNPIDHNSPKLEAPPGSLTLTKDAFRFRVRDIRTPSPSPAQKLVAGRLVAVTAGDPNPANGGAVGLSEDFGHWTLGAGLTQNFDPRLVTPYTFTPTWSDPTGTHKFAGGAGAALWNADGP